ncbi:MAG TPA: heme biosynthesis HemY N-terminal domain-containing protein, partial [Stellaceae bacterium]|nr:heme biosynthesis HemY N-terminal domain-containing protein [Stellaceae bacterium]
MRALPALVAIALLVAVAVVIADRPGSVEIAWQGWEIETSVAVLVIAAAVVGVVSAVLYGVVRFLVRGPRA